MKLAVFLVALVTVPWLIAATLWYLPKGRQIALSVLVAATTYVVDINLLAHLEYRGMSKALDVSSVDILGLGVLIFILWDSRRRGFRAVAPENPPTLSPVVIMPPLAWAFVMYFAVNVLSLIEATNLTYGLLDIAKLLRGMILFWIAANLIADDRSADALPSALALFVAIEVVSAGWDFIHGAWWVAATFGHKNEFAFAMNAVLPFLFARALIRPRRRLFFLALYGAGVIAVIISRSRTAWMTMVLGGGIVTVLSAVAFIRNDRARDLKRLGVILAVMFAAALPVAAKLADGVLARWSEDAVASTDFRKLHNEVAVDIATHHLFGVGVNNYVENLDTPVGDRIPEIDRTVVHNVYLFIAAETGWLGLAFFLGLLLSFGVLAARMYWKARSLRAIYVSVGALASLASSMLHSTMESGTFLRRHTYYIWCIVMGLVVAVGRRDGIARVSLVRWLVRRQQKRTRVRAPRPRR